jgi:DNA-binding NarL/FixJ family response regulator
VDVIRVAVVDDHAVVRTGVELFLAELSDMEVVGSAADGSAALALCADTRPDVVLMDLGLPGELDGLEATRRIVAEYPGTRVVVLTTFSDRARILAAIDAGAVGYVLKGSEPANLANAVRSAAQGGTPLDPIATEVVETRHEVPESLRGLSEQERRVLNLLAHGLPNREIAERMGISEATVKGHLTSIFRVIRVDDRTKAALWARRQGLGPPD